MHRSTLEIPGATLRAIALTTLLALSIHAVPVLAVDGSYDPDWGDRGRLAVDVSPGYDYGRSLLIEPDGKLLIGGDCEGYPCAMRLLATGSYDPDFGPPSRPGRVVIIGAVGWVGFAGIVSRPGGGAIIAGTSGDGDSSRGVTFEFDARGIVQYVAGFSEVDSFMLTGMAEQADGLLVLAGTTYASNVVVYRVDPDDFMRRDPNFGESGSKRIVLPGGFALAQVNALTLQPDGKVLVAGSVGNRVMLLRLLANGQLDDDPVTGFGDGGIALFDWGSPSLATAIVVDRDGSLLVAGQAYGGTGPDPSNDFFVNRLTSRGRQHPDFSLCPVPFCPPGPTYITFNLGGFDNDKAESIALQPDGKILVSGYARQTSSLSVFALARVLPGGEPDLDFGNGGQTWSWYAATTGQHAATAMAVGNGGLMIAGSSQEHTSLHPRFGIAKLQLAVAQGVGLFANGFE